MRQTGQTAVCERCQRTQWTAAVCHVEVDALEVQRAREAALVAGALEVTARWADAGPRMAAGPLVAQLSDRALCMHRLLASLVDERQLLEHALDLASERLARLESEVCGLSALCAAGPLPVRSGEGGERGEEGVGKGGSLAAVWRTLRAKEDECAVSTTMLRKMSAAWHREARESASEREDERVRAAAELESRDKRAALLASQLEFCQSMLEDAHRRVMQCKLERAAEVATRRAHLFCLHRVRRRTAQGSGMRMYLHACVAMHL